MAIRDRGKMKWVAAYIQPEQAKMHRDFWHDTERIKKPIIDEHEIEEFDLRISYSMEYGHRVKATIWDDGFTYDISGRIHYVDPITHVLRIEVKPGKFECVEFSSVVGIKVIN
ncbi:YolD-like family protein [Bacillus sp. BRMEA1]|uniref:YolD-like family protein n=1 Tax=Neobacillus endophyticus TaxID=2738405 RepID=UPI0015639AF3|nr:YolD-like family protein [Neobacillus endophyticus]NRD76202.1 YolD-like family protein [Neobacillus endophyticus]